MFEKLLERLEGVKPRVVCVEAAHIYMNETPGDEHFMCARVGARVAETLSGNGTHIVKMLFVDDYHPSAETATLDLPDYISQLKRAGFAPDTVISESGLADSARRLMESLNGQIVERDGKLYLVKPNLFLVAADGTLGCNLLDAALYLEKFRQFDFSITVLPETYKDQQKNVRRLLKAFGHGTVPIANIYCDAQGGVRVGL